MKKKLQYGLFFVAIFFFFSCNNSKIDEKLNHQVNHELNKDCGEVHWTYNEDEHGPTNWKNLCDGFSACGEKSQSPINIITNEGIVDSNLLALEINYISTPVNIVNNGHTIQFNVSGNNTISISDKDYKLLQFHFHAKSEHTMNGNHYPIEVHFVNQYSSSDYSVIGVMFEEGEINELLTEFLPIFPESKGEYNSEKIIDLKKLFPNNLSYYNYNGSLTTPPCSEVVNWIVLKNTIEASNEQIEKFSKILNGNYRPIMPLNERKILMFNE
ncbi:MAG: carbonic anhydrase [Ignavibacteriales bacterium CG18_big_fil_WC_8_21_14_2_50_31_20]|nr:MAG: carbonic anhydrase [Ignavibacteriales bacterium CG18_big_fil_WC_8_21_14_2_50_31_20]